MTADHSPGAAKVTAPDLRQQLADALIRSWSIAPDPVSQRIARAAADRDATTAAAVVQPVLDAKADEIARLRREVAEAHDHIAGLDEDIIQPERALHEETIQRAEAAEVEATRLRQQVANLRESYRLSTELNDELRRQLDQTAHLRHRYGHLAEQAQQTGGQP